MLLKSPLKVQVSVDLPDLLERLPCSQITLHLREAVIHVSEEKNIYVRRERKMEGWKFDKKGTSSRIIGLSSIQSSLGLVGTIVQFLLDVQQFYVLLVDLPKWRQFLLELEHAHKPMDISQWFQETVEDP